MAPSSIQQPWPVAHKPSPVVVQKTLCSTELSTPENHEADFPSIKRTEKNYKGAEVGSKQATHTPKLDVTLVCIRSMEDLYNS